MKIIRRDPWYFGNIQRNRQVISAIRAIYSEKSSCLVGDAVSTFESAVSEATGLLSPLAVSSGSSAFELILQDLHLASGDEVIVPAFGWMSVPGAVDRAGASLRIADVDQGLHASWAAIRAKLTERTRAVVIVHMRGFAAPDTVLIADELRRRGVALIEDCAQAWGCRIGPAHVGSFGDYAFFSTQHYKLITTGEGGLLVARDPDAVERLRWLAGRPDSKDRTHAWPRNVRLSEIQAAVGTLQVSALADTVSRLQTLSSQVAAAIAENPGLRVQAGAGTPESNGITVPIWCASDHGAQLFVESLSQFDLPCFRPGQATDLHNAQAWPIDDGNDIGELDGLKSLASYVDLPTPLLTGRRGRDHLTRVRRALERQL